MLICDMLLWKVYFPWHMHCYKGTMSNAGQNELVPNLPHHVYQTVKKMKCGRRPKTRVHNRHFCHPFWTKQLTMSLKRKPERLQAPGSVIRLWVVFLSWFFFLFLQQLQHNFQCQIWNSLFTSHTSVSVNLIPLCTSIETDGHTSFNLTLLALSFPLMTLCES